MTFFQQPSAHQLEGQLSLSTLNLPYLLNSQKQQKILHTYQALHKGLMPDQKIRNHQGFLPNAEASMNQIQSADPTRFMNGDSAQQMGEMLHETFGGLRRFFKYNTILPSNTRQADLKQSVFQTDLVQANGSVDTQNLMQDSKRRLYDERNLTLDTESWDVTMNILEESYGTPRAVYKHPDDKESQSFERHSDDSAFSRYNRERIEEFKQVFSAENRLPTLETQRLFTEQERPVFGNLMYTANIDENPIDMMGLFDDMPVVKYWDGGMNEQDESQEQEMSDD